jgi:hypothetical protein
VRADGEAADFSWPPAVGIGKVPSLGEAEVHEDGDIAVRQEDIGRLDIVVGCMSYDQRTNPTRQLVDGSAY